MTQININFTLQIKPSEQSVHNQKDSLSSSIFRKFKIFKHASPEEQKWKAKQKAYKATVQNLGNAKKQQKYEKRWNELNEQREFFLYLRDNLEFDRVQNPYEKLEKIETLLNNPNTPKKDKLHKHLKFLTSRIERISAYNATHPQESFTNMQVLHAMNVENLAAEDIKKAKEYIETRMKPIREEMMALDQKIDANYQEKVARKKDGTKAVLFSGHLHVHLV